MSLSAFDVGLALLAVLGICAFLTLIMGLHASLAPLCTLSSFSLLLMAGGILGVLYPTALVLYGTSYALGIFALVHSLRGRYRLPKAQRGPMVTLQLFTPGSVTFWLLAVSFAVYFSVRQPMFSEYDEFSLWGTAAKLTSTQNVLYTEAEIGWPWQATQNCGLITLSYFVQLFGSFAAWKVHLSFDLLLFACFAAVLGCLGWKNYAVAFPAALACWLAPYVFTVAGEQIYVSHVYMLAYGDIPAGAMFGGAVAFWLALRSDAKSRFWPMLPVLAMTANIKANTFVLSLAAAGLVAVDLLFFPRTRSRGIPRRLLRAAGAFAAPMAVYALWNVWYVNILVARNAESGGMGSTDSHSLISIAVNGIKLLFNLPVDSYFAQNRDFFRQCAVLVWNAFWSERITMLGAGWRVVVFLGILLVWILILLPAWKPRLAAALMWVLTAVCFAGYNFMLILSYAFIFNADVTDGLVDYNRYLYTFYLGWFLITMALLCIAVTETRRKITGGLSVLALSVAFFVLFRMFINPELNVIGYDDAEFSAAQVYERQVENVVEAIEDDPDRTKPLNEIKLFLIYQGDSGQQWFRYSYSFLPLMLEYGNLDLGGGGGTYGDAFYNDGSLYYHAYSKEDFWDYLSKNCDYLFIRGIDDTFTLSYESLFVGESRTSTPRGMALYRVTENGLELVSSIEVAQ